MLNCDINHLFYWKMYPRKTHKVRMLLDLPDTPEALWDSFKSKLRSQIKRAMKEDMTTQVGGMELLNDFYRVFSENMRDLGTPVWSKKLLYQVLDQLDDMAHICLVYNKKNTCCRRVFDWV